MGFGDEARERWTNKKKTFNVNLLVLEICLDFYRKWLGGYFKNPKKDGKGQKHSSGNKDDTFKP